MKPFEESDRYEYPLTPESVVLDCGGYEGRFATGIHERYGCTAHVLEPVKRFYDQIVERFKDAPKIHVHHFGIANTTGQRTFHIKGDMTGLFASGGESERVEVKSPEEVFAALGIESVALLKLNIEGGEFSVIESMIGSGLIANVKNLQVQWHDVAPKAAERYTVLQLALAKTHHLTFDADWVWQNWSIGN